jgi:VWFA-related protein
MPVRPKPRVYACVLFVIALAAVFTWPAGARQSPPPSSSLQNPPQVFRAGTDVVPIYATVRDPKRGFVLDLTADDFELYDEGNRRPITQFSIAAQPLGAVFLIDGSGSMVQELNRAIEGARNFVLRMLPDDRVRIGSFADRVVLSPRFTSNPDELLAYMKDEFNLRLGNETHLWEGLLEATVALSEEEGKRAVVVVSDGYNFVVPEHCKPDQPTGGSSAGYPPAGGRGPVITLPPIGPGTSNPARGKPIMRPPPAAKPGVPGPTGPQPLGLGCRNEDMARYGVTIGQVTAAASARNVVVFALSMWTRQRNTTDRPHRELERLALDTGGAFHEIPLSDDMNPVFTDVMQQLRQQYVLGFVPASFDGKRHSVTVRVKRPGLQVQSRRFYIAERAK